LCIGTDIPVWIHKDVPVRGNTDVSYCGHLMAKEPTFSEASPFVVNGHRFWRKRRSRKNGNIN